MLAISEFVQAFFRKDRIRLDLEKMLSSESIRRARMDSHAKRKPRSCGLTIHCGLGCPNKCAYCYIQDIGFQFAETRPYKLTGQEMVLSLLYNPWFVPGLYGTFLAFGSISDPFHPNCIDRTLDYFSSIARFLGNPCQFSTKMHIDEETAEKLKAIENLQLSPLITVVALGRADKLEPRAPPPERRMETITNLAKAGFKPVLFLRPLIPGLIEGEMDDLLESAGRAGAVGVVAGSLRVSRKILTRMKHAGFNIELISRRIKSPLKNKLVSVPSQDLKEGALIKARKLGLIPFSSACCANAFSAGVPCMSLCWTTKFCTNCPNNCTSKIPSPSLDEAYEAIERVCKVKPAGVEVTKNRVRAGFKRGKSPTSIKLYSYRHVLQLLLRRRVELKEH